VAIAGYRRIWFSCKGIPGQWELFSAGGKWLELLKEIAPHVRRVAFLFNPATAPYFDVYLKPFKSAAASLGLEGFSTPVHEVSEFETIFVAQARIPNSGLVLIPDGFLNVHRVKITSLAAQYHLPAVYPWRYFAEVGGCCPTELTSVINFDLRQITPIAF
jgi:putative ABC transport system substrate-binding protein